MRKEIQRSQTIDGFAKDLLWQSVMAAAGETPVDFQNLVGTSRIDVEPRWEVRGEII